MCGIIGKVDTSVVDVTKFNKARDVLEHRGPDGFGTKILADETVALGHRRLSIIDLSKNGEQPMSNEDFTIWITFNGEIYNYKTLKELLIKEGHVFKSNSDTEVLVHGYEQWGLDGLLKLVKGMFAFAIWDENIKKLLIARDRFGIKPLYYYLGKTNFVFASEIKALIADESVPRNLDILSVYDFFVYRFIPAPKTIWKEIKKLPVASFLVFDFGSWKCEEKKYWTIPVGNEKYEEKKLIKDFEELLTKSVSEHLIADVPVGLFLSGGYDSSALAYMTNKLGDKLNSFSIGFEGWPESEHESARVVSEIFNTIHHEKIVNVDSLDVLHGLSYYYDEPLGGSSFLPTYLVAQLAKENKTKVVLSGDGGDELLGGYKWHSKINSELLQRRWWSKLTEKDTDYLLRRYFEEMSWAGFTYKEINKAFDGAFSENALPEDLWLYREMIQDKAGNIKNLQLLDLNTFMPEVILNKVDRASMANSIEVRVPFLDHELVSFFMQAEVDSYYEQGVFKKPLREIFKNVLPNSILNKPKKGFGSPVHKMSSSDKYLKKNDGNGRIFQLNGTQDKRKLWAASIYNNWADHWLK